MHQIAIISENIIFTKLLDSYLRRKVSKCLIIQFSSFPDIKEIIDRTDFDLIIVDGIISGVASFEIVNYLRHDKKVICPIYYFSDAHNDFFKIKPYITGVNYHYKKPFDAHAVTNEIAAFLSTKSQLIS
jgi:DNA-binding response OmpR family regulator